MSASHLRLFDISPQDQAALYHLPTTTPKSACANDPRRTHALALRGSLVSSLATLLTLFFLLVGNSSATPSYSSISNSDYPSNALALISQGYNFTEPRRLNLDSGNQPDTDKAINTPQKSPDAGINFDTRIVGCRHDFDQRLRHFCHSLNPRAPPRLS